MDFNGLEIHPIFLKTLTDFDGNWPIKTSSELCKQKHTSLKNGDQEIQIYVVQPGPNFDHLKGITLTKFSLNKFTDIKFDHVFDENFDRVNGL